MELEILLTALIPILAVAVIIILSMRIASRSFKCKKCDNEFHIKWTQVLVTEHSDDEYMLVCPHCKNKGWCKMEMKK